MMGEEKTFLEKYLYWESLLHRYFAWQKRTHGRYANPLKGQGRILSILKLQPEITQKEMIFLLDMRPQSLGELLNKLEKAGFITREPSSEDRRVMVVKLTEAGAQEADKLDTTEKETLFDVLTETEQEQFENIIDKLTQAIEAKMPDEFRSSGAFHRHGFGGAKGFHGRCAGEHHPFPPHKRPRPPFGHFPDDSFDKQ